MSSCKATLRPYVAVNASVCVPAEAAKPSVPVKIDSDSDSDWDECEGTPERRTQPERACAKDAFVSKLEMSALFPGKYGED